ncbi:hypothetical protein X777_08998, partial [Ooceraea biroi]
RRWHRTFLAIGVAIPNVVVVVVFVGFSRGLSRGFYEIIPDDPLAIAGFCSHPHPVSRERNASQVVIFLCSRRGGDAEWQSGDARMRIRGRESKSDENRRATQRAISKRSRVRYLLKIPAADRNEENEARPTEITSCAVRGAFLAYISGD